MGAGGRGCSQRSRFSIETWNPGKKKQINRLWNSCTRFPLSWYHAKKIWITTLFRRVISWTGFMILRGNTPWTVKVIYNVVERRSANIMFLHYDRNMWLNAFFFTADILTCHSRNNTGGTNGCTPFRCVNVRMTSGCVWAGSLTWLTGSQPSLMLLVPLSFSHYDNSEIERVIYAILCL